MSNKRSEVAPGKQSQSAGRLGLRSGLMKGMANERDDVAERLGPVPDPGSSITAAVDRAEAYSGRGASSSVRSRLPIRLEECVSNPFNPRQFYIPESIDALAVQLKRDGQYEAIKVTRSTRFPGKYVIIDGERRFRAKKSLGEVYVDAEVFEDLSDMELYLVANRINKERAVQTVYDDAVSWNNLLKEGVYADQDALAAGVEVSKAQVSKILSLNALPSRLLRRMAENSEVVGLNHAYNLKMLFDRKGAEWAEEALQKVIDGEMSVRKLEEMARRTEADDTGRRTKSHYAAQVKFAYGERDFGELKRYQDGRTELKLTGLTTDEQALLAARIEAVVREVIGREENAAIE